jgi:hypothetical protein
VVVVVFPRRNSSGGQRRRGIEGRHRKAGKGNSGHTSTIAIVLIGVLIFSLAGVSGCTKSSEFPAPKFVEPYAAVIEVIPEQLYAEYTADEAAASAKYKGKRLSFIGVTAEKIVNEFYVYPPPGTADLCVVVGSFKFRPMYEAYVDDIREGFVLDIVGEVMGLIYGSLYINDCWIQIVERKGGPPQAPQY